MNVLDAVTSAKSGVQGVLVAKPPLTWGAEAQFVQLTEDYRVPQPILEAGFEYLLGTEDLLNLIELARKKRISDKAIAELVIHYAMTDTTPAWIDDIPDV